MRLRTYENVIERLPFFSEEVYNPKREKQYEIPCAHDE